MLMTIRDVLDNKEINLDRLYTILRDKSNYLLEAGYLTYTLDEVNFFTIYDKEDEALNKFSMLKMNWSWNGVKKTKDLLKEYKRIGLGEKLAFVKEYEDVVELWDLGGYNRLNDMPSPMMGKLDLIKALRLNSDFYLDCIKLKID